MIIANNIIKKYGNKYVLKNFNYVFGKGIYVLRGKSGKGKTTLLNIIGLNDYDYEGNLMVEGNVLFIRDKENLVSNLTVKDHFDLFEKINCKKVDDLFNLKEIYNKKVKNLSLGERQMVSLTIALNAEEENILLDEPFSALSRKSILKAYSFVEKKGQDKTIILSSHNDCIFKHDDIDLGKVKKDKKEVINKSANCKKKRLKKEYLYLYFKKVLFKKIVFIISLISTFIGFFSVNNILDKNFDSYLESFKREEGVIVNRKNKVEELDENVFYELIKKLSFYTKDYNINYYNSSLYDLEISVDGYYIDNGFVFSSIKYIEEDLKDDEIVLGLNYNDFCLKNSMSYCDYSYLDTLLVNKKIKDFPYRIKSVFETEETTVFCNKRFVKIFDENEYEEYYFDVLKEDEEEMYKLINNDEFLSSFEFVLIGENKEYYRYKVEVKEYSYFNNIEYKNYIACLEKGYNCLNYISHFNTLIKINDYGEIKGINLKIIDKELNNDEIVISSSLNEKLNLKENDKAIFFFNYNDEIKEGVFYVKEIIEDNEYTIYQNSEWSIELFKNILKFDEKDLRIKNIVIYDNILTGDYEAEDIYKEMLSEFSNLFIKMKRRILIISLWLCITNVGILVFLEIYQNKFKKEYFGYLKTLNVNTK